MYIRRSFQDVNKTFFQDVFQYFPAEPFKESGYGRLLNGFFGPRADWARCNKIVDFS